ncbi:AMP-binding protein [Salinispora arenicola]|nr:AMP-binding protein [Salinispora arenicola]
MTAAPTLHGGFVAHAAAYPDTLAVLSTPAVMTYGRLDETSAALAERLSALGAGPGVPIGVCIERTPDLLVAILAELRAGACLSAARSLNIQRATSVSWWPTAGPAWSLPHDPLRTHARTAVRARPGGIRGDSRPAASGRSSGRFCLRHIYLRLDRHAQGGADPAQQLRGDACRGGPNFRGL